MTILVNQTKATNYHSNALIGDLGQVVQQGRVCQKETINISGRRLPVTVLTVNYLTSYELMNILIYYKSVLTFTK
jgi:hypothetical protein